MAWIRMEAQRGTYAGKQQYDGICEQSDDLTAENNYGYAVCNSSQYVMGVGSIALCIEDRSINVKVSDGSWQKIGEEGPEQETTE